MSDIASPLARLFMVEPENDWRTEAACRSMDAAIFFSPEHFETKQEKDAREAAAKQVCGGCPVREACLDYAVTAQEKYGIWGGLTELERRAVVRRRAAEAKKSRVS